jgi:hypothetical protein
MGIRIIMVVHQRGAFILLTFSLLILFSCGCLPVSMESQLADSIKGVECNQLADVLPTINDWGISGHPNESEAFTVWANVTDADLDLANVSVHVSGPNTTINELMPFNGTFYVASLEAFVDVGIYDMYVSATDFANNSRLGRHVFVQIQADSTDTPDPNITMPFVVVSSVIAGIVVCIVAYYYRVRKLSNTS